MCGGVNFCPAKEDARTVVYAQYNDLFWNENDTCRGDDYIARTKQCWRNFRKWVTTLKRPALNSHTRPSPARQDTHTNREIHLVHTNRLIAHKVHGSKQVCVRGTC